MWEPLFCPGRQIFLGSWKHTLGEPKNYFLGSSLGRLRLFRVQHHVYLAQKQNPTMLEITVLRDGPNRAIPDSRAVYGVSRPRPSDSSFLGNMEVQSCWTERSLVSKGAEGLCHHSLQFWAGSTPLLSTVLPLYHLTADSLPMEGQFHLFPCICLTWVKKTTYLMNMSYYIRRIRQGSLILTSWAQILLAFSQSPSLFSPSSLS